jgi:hypothetical protein
MMINGRDHTLMSVHFGYEKAATTPEIPVGSKSDTISAVTLMMSAGVGSDCVNRLRTLLAAVAVYFTFAAFLKKSTTSLFLL